MTKETLARANELQATIEHLQEAHELIEGCIKDGTSLGLQSTNDTIYLRPISSEIAPVIGGILTTIKVHIDRCANELSKL